MQDIDTIIFDFDGTLAKTYPIIFFSFQSIFKEYNKQRVTPEQIIRMFGPPEQEIIKHQFRDQKDVTSIIERYHHLYRTYHNQLVKPDSSITRMLKVLTKRGYLLAIVTGKGRYSLDISLDQLWSDPYFAATIAGDEVETPKPHPEGILKALTLMDKSPQHSVYVGDSIIDYQAGKAAGVRTFGVRWFDTNDDESWQEVQPDFRIDSTDEFLSLFPGPAL